MLKCIVGVGLTVVLFAATGARAAEYYLTFTGTVGSTNGCTFPSTIDCYAPVGSQVSGSFHYNTGAPGLTPPTQDLYRNLMLDYSLTIVGSGFTGTSSNASGFGRFTVSRDTGSQATATASTFAAYVAKEAGNYTFLSGTNTVPFTPRVATTAAVAGDNIYGDLAISEVRVNFGALSPIFADLQVPTTFTFADLSPSVSNFAISLVSDLFLGNNAAYGIGGGLTSVTVTPVTSGDGGPTSTPEPHAAAVFILGLLAFAGIRRLGRGAV